MRGQPAQRTAKGGSNEESDSGSRRGSCGTRSCCWWQSRWRAVSKTRKRIHRSRPQQPTSEHPPAPPVNHAPEISGTPEPGGQAGKLVLVHAAGDRRRQRLPRVLDRRTSRRGRRSTPRPARSPARPTDANVGDTADITISVTDGRDTRSVGPFKIKVKPRNVPPPPNRRRRSPACPPTR